MKIFAQVNIGNENQKTGIAKNKVGELVSYCKEIGLNLIGLMCIPPSNTDPEGFFEEMRKLNQDNGFTELSMGMSSDFLSASKHLSTFLRIGSSIFGQRYQKIFIFEFFFIILSIIKKSFFSKAIHPAVGL